MTLETSNGQRIKLISFVSLLDLNLLLSSLVLVLKLNTLSNWISLKTTLTIMLILYKTVDSASAIETYHEHYMPTNSMYKV